MISRKTHIVTLAVISAVLVALPVFAQDAEPATEEEAKQGSSEVEYSEDNYRRFMELKDQNLEKSSMPTNAYQAGQQKLDELPEASQKHLRNELREVILQEGEWAAGDENNDYPYVPSEAAKTDGGLKQQEAEAWDELVGKYQEREAQIHANSSRSDAAGAAAGSPGSDGKAGAEGKKGANNGDQANGNQQKQGAGEQQSEENSDQGSYSPGSASQAKDPNAKSTAGVSENAMEFLTRNGNGGTQKTPGNGMLPEGTQAGGSGGPEPYGNDAQAQSNGEEQGPTASEAQSQAGAEAQAQDGNEGQALADASDQADASGEEQMQAAQENPSEPSRSASAAPPPPSNVPDAESTAGTSQNAMEFLMNGDNQNSSASADNPQSADSSAQQEGLPELPALNGEVTENAPRQENTPANPNSPAESSSSPQSGVISTGTLSIQDLINVQGVSNSTTTPPQQGTGDTPEEKTKKDGDG